MYKFKTQSWGKQTVVYHVESGDMYLLTVQDAEILNLIANKSPDKHLLDYIILVYGLTKKQAESVVTDFVSEFQKLNLID